MARVAITGVAISCALGTGTDEVWTAIRDGESGIALTRRLDVSKLTCHCSGEMAEVPEPTRAEAAAEGWSMPRGRLDRATLLALGTAREAILTSAVDLATMDGYRCGVALGTSVGGLDEGGARILGYVRGYALTSDAHHAPAPDPRGDGARRAMRGALDQAGLRPTDVDYVNGHGTGTPANDSAETKAVEAVFGAGETPPISSTKSQIGHNLGAAGAVEAAVSVLALRDGVLPPTVNVADEEEGTRDIVPNEARPAAGDR